MPASLMRSEVTLPTGSFAYTAPQPEYAITPLSVGEQFSFGHAFVAPGQGVINVPAFTYTILLDPAHVTQFDANGHCTWHGLLREQLSIIAAPQLAIETTWNTPIRALAVFLSPQFISQAIGDARVLEEAIGFGHYGLDDRTIWHLGQTMVAHHTQFGAVDALFADLTATLLAVHTARCYGYRDLPSPLATKRLSADEMRQIDTFIHDHIAQKLSLSALAAVVNRSPTYFARLFKQTTHQTPHAYVQNLRVQRAKLYLQLGTMTPAEIASALGFAHQSHFIRVFRHFTKGTPGEFLKACKNRR